MGFTSPNGQINMPGVCTVSSFRLFTSPSKPGRHVRTAAYPSDVSENQAALFLDYLDEAYQLLDECVEHYADQPEVFARQIRVCMGLSDAETAQASFQTLLQLDEGHVQGHVFMHQLLTPKWLGSKREIDDFSDWVAAKTDKYPLLCLITLMHMAECYFILAEEDEKNAPKQFKKEFLPIIRERYTWFQAQKGLHASYQNHILNYFAFLFHVCDEKDERHRLINQLDPNIPLQPWGYLGIGSSTQFWNYKW